MTEIINSDKKNLNLRFYPSTKNQENKKIYKVHCVISNYKPGDILCHFLDKSVYTKKHLLKLLIINKYNQFNIYNKIFLLRFLHFDFVGILNSFFILIFFWCDLLKKISLW
jgi:hypothetical protein